MSLARACGQNGFPHLKPILLSWSSPNRTPPPAEISLVTANLSDHNSDPHPSLLPFSLHKTVSVSQKRLDSARLDLPLICSLLRFQWPFPRSLPFSVRRRQVFLQPPHDLLLFLLLRFPHTSIHIPPPPPNSFVKKIQRNLCPKNKTENPIAHHPTKQCPQNKMEKNQLIKIPKTPYRNTTVNFSFHF